MVERRIANANLTTFQNFLGSCTHERRVGKKATSKIIRFELAEGYRIGGMGAGVGPSS